MQKNSRHLSLGLLATGIAAIVLLGLSPQEKIQAHGRIQTSESFGPPEWVLEAWETGEDPVVPQEGPPEWVVETWKAGDRPAGTRSGPPPWVRKAHEQAQEKGLEGPPAWVIEAWENGEGHELGGPPQWVLETLQD